MAGKLGLSTPWTRQAISRESRLDVEEAIPDGYTLGVSMSPNRDKWVFWIIRPGESARGTRLMVTASMSLTSAAFFALRHWRLIPDTVVRVDPLGYVKEIEDAG